MREQGMDMLVKKELSIRIHDDKKTFELFVSVVNKLYEQYHGLYRTFRFDHDTIGYNNIKLPGLLNAIGFTVQYMENNGLLLRHWFGYDNIYNDINQAVLTAKIS